MASTILEQILENISRGARLPSMQQPPPPAHAVPPAASPRAVEDAGVLMREVMEEMDQRLSRMVEQVLTHPALGQRSASPAPSTDEPTPVSDPPPLQGGTEAIDDRRAATLRNQYAPDDAVGDFAPIVTEERAEEEPIATLTQPSFPAAGPVGVNVAPIEVSSDAAGSNDGESPHDFDDTRVTDNAAWEANLLQSSAIEDHLTEDAGDGFSKESIESMFGDEPEDVVDDFEENAEVEEPEMPTEEELELDDADGFALELGDLDSATESHESTEDDAVSISSITADTSELATTESNPTHDFEETDSVDLVGSDEAEDDSVASLIGGNEPPGERLLDLVGDDSSNAGAPSAVVSVSGEGDAIEQVEAIVEEIAATCGVGVVDGEGDVPEGAEAVVNPALAEIRDLLVPLQSVPSLLERQGAPTQQILRQMQVLADEVRELARAPRVAASPSDEDVAPAEDKKATERRRVAIDDIQGMIQSLS